MNTIQTWVFDLDGTLVEAMPYQELINEVAKMAGRTFTELFTEYRTNFQGAAAMKAYHLSLVPEAERSKVEELYEICHASSANPDLLEGSVEVLQLLRNRGCRILLWSKGDRAFQVAKLVKLGLAPYFDDVLVTTAKGRTEAVIEHLLPAVGDSTWAMVGDSFEQDILPSLHFADRLFWIQGGRANALARPESWEPHPNLVPVAHISAVLALLQG